MSTRSHREPFGGADITPSSGIRGGMERNIQDDLGFMDFVDCSICGHSYTTEDGQDTRLFWLTSCGHILCSGSDHQHVKGHCTYCGKSGMETFPIDQEISTELKPWFVPTGPTISAMQKQLNIVKFQNSQLVAFARRRSLENVEGRKRIKELSEKNAELIGIFETLKIQLENARQIKEENENLKKENSKLQQELTEALKKIVASKPIIPLPPTPQPGYNGYGILPITPAGYQTAFYPNGHPGQMPLPTLYEGVEEENEEGYGFQPNDQGEMNGFYQGQEGRGMKRGGDEGNNEPHRSIPTLPPNNLHHRSQGGSWTPNPTISRQPARITLRPGSSLGEKQSNTTINGSAAMRVRTNLEQYRVNNRKPQNGAQAKTQNPVIYTQKSANRDQDQDQDQTDSPMDDRRYKTPFAHQEQNSQHQDQYPSNHQDFTSQGPESASGRRYQAPQASAAVPRFLS